MLSDSYRKSFPLFVKCQLLERDVRNKERGKSINQRVMWTDVVPDVLAKLSSYSNKMQNPHIYTYMCVYIYIYIYMVYISLMLYCTWLIFLLYPITREKCNIYFSLMFLSLI